MSRERQCTGGSYARVIPSCCQRGRRFPRGNAGLKPFRHPVSRYRLEQRDILVERMAHSGNTLIETAPCRAESEPDMPTTKRHPFGFVIVEDSDEDFDIVQQAVKRAGFPFEVFRAATGGDHLTVLVDLLTYWLSHTVLPAGEGGTHEK